MANGSSPESSPDSSSGDSPASSPPPPPPSSDDSSSSAPPPSDSDKSPPPPQSLTPPPPSSDHDSGSQSSPPPPENSTAASPPPPPEAPATIVRSPPPPSAIRVFSPPPPVAAGSSGSQNGSTAAAENSTYVSPESLPDSRSVASSSSSSSKAPVEIGVLVAFGAIMLLMMVVCLVCCRRKKKKRHDLPPYGWGPAPPGEGQYWQSTHQEHAVKIHPPTGMVATWGSPNPNPNPTPSPHTTNSGEMSGPYSGSHGTPLPPPTPNLGLGFNKSTFSYEELAAATNGFAQANMLGQGGFGFVHKGVLPNGKEVAVKSLKSGSGQGEREFQSEVDIISRVHHRHLVSLVGYCIAGGQRMLVYEFVANNNLEYHLHKRGDPPLDCSTRYRIALGSAKGLAYLHEDCHPRIIHRDIKAANILLDENFEAMVADFGLAKLTTDTNTHVSTRVMGTFGYLAPEYASSGKLTEKSDVFSFGVMLLELITGRRPVDANMKYMEDSLVDWARPVLAKAMEDHNYDQLADPRFERNYNTQEMARMVACAAASIRHSAKKRPKMSQIVRALEGDVSLDDLNEGTKPGQSTIYGLANSSSDYDANAYSADLKKFRQMAFATQDFGSEYGTTSEYGLNASSSSDDSREMRSKQF